MSCSDVAIEPQAQHRCRGSVELELAALRGRLAMVEAELVAVRAARDQLAGQVERLSSENHRLQTHLGELAAPVEQLRRASMRQAAPFSKGTVVSQGGSGNNRVPARS